MIKYSINLFHLVLIGLWFAVPIDSDANPTAAQSVEPTLTRVEPNNDMVSGGANVRIIGENFQDGATVTIDGRAASNVIFVSPTELTVEVPAGAAGSVNVVVTNPDGKSGTLTGGFTYIEPPPTLTRVEPSNDVVTGGTTVKIIGANFQDGTTVTIGGRAASNVIFVSSTELTVEVPAGAAGSVNVVVTNPDGKSDTLAGGFTYIEPPAPTLTRVEPSNDVVTGGTTVKIIGANFQDGATVTIGGNAASNVIFVSPTELEVEAPAGVAGSANIVVTNPDGKSVTVAGGFTYTPLRYDVTGDGIVNILDLVRVASQFGETGTGLEGDVDDNGVVNIFDLVVVANHFSQE
ncbi:hypothetical protein C6502_12900 [Candidatus Poribacteria bacterium]|nr:MAG: hypothetical protein C6502_12900 [Candidatus Poribacteria bacterium]